MQRESSYGVAEEERVAPWHTLEADLGMITYATLCVLLTARVTCGPTNGEVVCRRGKQRSSQAAHHSEVQCTVLVNQ